MLNRLARLLAAEVQQQDWSDAHSRLDGARHERQMDYKSASAPTLTPEETDVVKANVAWVICQALYEDDPESFDEAAAIEFFTKAGVNDKWIHTSRGALNGTVWAGIRTHR